MQRLESKSEPKSEIEGLCQDEELQKDEKYFRIRSTTARW